MMVLDGAEWTIIARPPEWNVYSVQGLSEGSVPTGVKRTAGGLPLMASPGDPLTDGACFMYGLTLGRISQLKLPFASFAGCQTVLIDESA